jgi:hypothetical protein
MTCSVPLPPNNVIKNQQMQLHVDNRNSLANLNAKRASTKWITQTVRYTNMQTFQR